MRTSRRTFIAMSGAALLAPRIPARGANETLHIAVLGVRSKGDQHISVFNSLPGVKVVSLCDPDRKELFEKAEKHGVARDKCHTDLRRVMDDREIDAVVVATPNHWHALATIWACQAGKDVYVEKPCSHTIWEGRQMIAAARKHNRIVQVGTQRRSDEFLRQAFERLRGGELGKILRVRACYFNLRNSIGKVSQAQPVPESVDYNLWCGPAADALPLRQQFHYDWHWFWNTGNGELGNNGPHSLDLARWALGYDRLPRRVLSYGGRYLWDDNGQTPNTHVVYYDYEPAPIIIEIRNLPQGTGMRVPDQYKGVRIGITVECEGGYFSGMDGGGFYDHEGNRLEAIGGDGGRNHQANFIQAVRSRKVQDLNCDIATGHVSTSLCHLGNISHRLGRESGILQHERRDWTVEADAYDKMLAHLHANGVDLGTSKLTYGPTLDFDPQSERFTGELAPQANAHLRGTYRQPFSVPQIA